MNEAYFLEYHRPSREGQRADRADAGIQASTQAEAAERLGVSWDSVQKARKEILGK